MSAKLFYFILIGSFGPTKSVLFIPRPLILVSTIADEVRAGSPATKGKCRVEQGPQATYNKGPCISVGKISFLL